jgi:lipopolysaccharide transport system permease protein
MDNISSSIEFAWRSRRAWWFTATARTRERFARTRLGSLWLGLSNMFSVLVLAIVYGTVFKVDSFNSYVVYLGIGFTTWNAIASSLQSAPNLLVRNASNIKNTNINPIFYSLEEWAFQIQTFFQSLGVVIFILILFQPTLILHLITSGIIPLVNLLIFIYWFPLILCLIGAAYEDLYQLVPIIIQLVFLLSPILYEEKSLGSLAWAAKFNPLYSLVSHFRDSLITGQIVIGREILVTSTNLAGLLIALILLVRRAKFLPFIL